MKTGAAKGWQRGREGACATRAGADRGAFDRSLKSNGRGRIACWYGRPPQRQSATLDIPALEASANRELAATKTPGAASAFAVPGPS